MLAYDPVSEFKTFGNIVDACVSYYQDNVEKVKLDSVRKNRVALSGFVEKFHRDCGTLTPEVQEKIDALRGDDCMVVMSAHQPNLFAYSGVMRKITLTSALAKELDLHGRDERKESCGAGGKPEGPGHGRKERQDHEAVYIPF